MVMPLGNEDPPRIVPWATFLLVLLNLVGFGLEVGKPSSFAVAYAVTPYEITHEIDIHHPFRYLVEPGSATSESSPAGANDYLVHQAAGPNPIWLTLFTALFLHADSIHLAGNMLFLFIFGQKIEEAFGRTLFLGFYVGCGVVGTLIQVVVTPESLTPTLGASGAIAGIMGAYLVWFPRDRVRVLLLQSPDPHPSLRGDRLLDRYPGHQRVPLEWLRCPAGQHRLRLAPWWGISGDLHQRLALVRQGLAESD